MQNTIVLEGTAVQISKEKEGISFTIEQKQIGGIVSLKVYFDGSYIPQENDYIIVVGRLISLKDEFIVYANNVMPKSPNIDDLIKEKFGKRG